MGEGTEERPSQTGGENTGVDEEVAGRADEGRRSARTTPPIADDAKHGQTSSPAPDDDVGVPPDEEMSREK